jgi:hypothetical protein
MFAREVEESPDFERIQALPRRKVTLAKGEAAAELLTPMLATKEGLRRGVRLRPWQALPLLELAQLRKGFFGGSTGIGKTLALFLAPTVVEAKKPLLILPGNLVDDTWTKFAAYQRDWRAPRPMYNLISFEALQSDDNWNYLQRYEPDFIAIEECHKLRNPERAVCKRIDRYQRKHKGGLVMFPVSGSPINVSVFDIAHFLIWSHQKAAPVPHNKAEREMWAAAVDLNEPRRGQRPGVGVLVDLVPKLKPRPTRVGTARRAFMKRLLLTPGIVIADDTECDAPLDVVFEVAPDDPKLDVVFKGWRLKFKMPDGQIAGDLFSQLRWEDELSSGFFQKWDPAPPEEWREACGAKNDFVRYWVKRSTEASRPLDTEGAVLRAHKTHPVVQEWLKIKPTFTPKTVPTWLSSSVVDRAARYIRKHNGLVVVRSPLVGRAIARAAGVNYYGSKGLDASGRYIERERKGRGAVMSLKANAEGRNLQYLWHDMLWVSVPRNALELEQGISRIHRYGQTEACKVRILCTSSVTYTNWLIAQERADWAQEMAPHINKILTVDPRPPVYRSQAHRWGNMALDLDRKENAA